MTAGPRTERPSNGVQVPVDAHVHLHPAFDRARFLDAALDGFMEASPGADPAGVLLLVETAGATAFEDLRDGRDRVPPPWTIEPTGEDVTVMARHGDGPRIALVAGRQIATRERLEVLVYGARPTGLEGIPFEAALDRALEIPDSFVAVPWGFGKWWGNRGALVRRAIERHGPRFFLGDNGGRPRTYREPGLFREAASHGVRILPGSDPLPMRFEQTRPGSYGFLCTGDGWLDGPFATIRAALASDPSQPVAFGRRVGWAGFARSQVALRLADGAGDGRRGGRGDR